MSAFSVAAASTAGLSPTPLADLAVGVPAVLGALCFLVAAVAMTRVGDALSRINVLSVATGLGMVFFVVAAYAHVTQVDEFAWIALFEALVAIGATLVVTSVASVTLARAAYLSSDRHDPRTLYDDLAVDDPGSGSNSGSGAAGDPS